MPPLTPAAVWRISPDVVRALDERLGPPLDSYVNGTQTWLTVTGRTDEGVGGEARSGPGLEWRLHPVAGYRTRAGLSHYDVWDEALGALAAGNDEPLRAAWDGLECFPAPERPSAGDPEPAVLAARARELLGLEPDRVGLVDHDRIGTTWERDRDHVSIVGMLLDELGTRP